MGNIFQTNINNDKDKNLSNEIIDSDILYTQPLNNLNKVGLQITQVQANSPGEECGLKANVEFIMIINEQFIKNLNFNKLQKIVKNSIDKPLKMIVYSEIDFEFREVSVIPSKNWSEVGIGLLGINVKVNLIRTKEDLIKYDSDLLEKGLYLNEEKEEKSDHNNIDLMQDSSIISNVALYDIINPSPINSTYNVNSEIENISTISKNNEIVEELIQIEFNDDFDSLLFTNEIKSYMNYPYKNDFKYP